MPSPESFPAPEEQLPQETPPAEPENESVPETSPEKKDPDLSEKEAQAVAKEIAAADKGFVSEIRNLVNSKVEESRLPTKEALGYESTMGVYGGKLVHDESGRLVYDTRGMWSKIDRWGDRILRAFDDNQAKRPLKMILRRPRSILKLLPMLADSKRYRGTPEQTVENAKRFGLEQYYGPHPWGVEIKDEQAYSHSYALQDIFRQDLIGHEAIIGIDRFDATAKAAEYMHTLHEKGGGIAESGASSFLFTEKDAAGRVGKPILGIPTELYNPEKNVSEIERRTTDLLDFLASTATEEYRRSKEWESVRKVLETALGHYGDRTVIDMADSFIQRGRLTLPGDFEGLDFENSKMYKASRPLFGVHNTARMGIKHPEMTAQLRKEISEACKRFLASHPKQ